MAKPIGDEAGAAAGLFVWGAGERSLMILTLGTYDRWSARNSFFQFRK